MELGSDTDFTPELPYISLEPGFQWTRLEYSQGILQLNGVWDRGDVSRNKKKHKNKKKYPLFMIYREINQL